MFTSRKWIRVALMLFSAILLFSAEPSAAVAQKRHTSKPHRAGRQHYFVVQARDPRWRLVTVAPTRQAALVIKANLVQRGFQVRVRKDASGHFQVFSRMMHWRAVGVYTTRPLADHAVVILRYRGLQARVKIAH